MDKPWFQDTKTSCEKQAHYFVRIRKLQDQLIHREQHNLINAMERLKQITYPRKRPVIRNFDTDPSSEAPSVQNFPARNLNLRKMAKHKAIQGKEQPELSTVSGKPLISKPGHNKKPDSSGYHHFFVMPPLLSDRDIAKIVHHANSTFPSEPSTYLLQPHLPSIPNVGRKTTFMVDNRFKLLTLAESEFCDQGEGSVSGMRKQLHTGKSQRRKKSSKSKSRLDDHASSENATKRSGKNVLTFDVDPNDPSLFSHCVEDKKEEEQYETTPLPPPNSRPSSTKSKSSHVLLHVEGEDIQGDSQTITSKGSGGAAVEDTVAASTDKDNISAEKVEMPDVSSKGDNTIIINESGGEQISDANDLPSDLAPVENKQDRADQVNDNDEAVEISQPVVTITSKPASVDGVETDQEN